MRLMRYVSISAPNMPRVMRRLVTAAAFTAVCTTCIAGNAFGSLALEKVKDETITTTARALEIDHTRFPAENAFRLMIHNQAAKQMQSKVLATFRTSLSHRGEMVDFIVRHPKSAKSILESEATDFDEFPTTSKSLKADLANISKEMAEVGSRNVLEFLEKTQLIPIEIVLLEAQKAGWEFKHEKTQSFITKLQNSDEYTKFRQNLLSGESLYSIAQDLGYTAEEIKQAESDFQITVSKTDLPADDLRLAASNLFHEIRESASRKADHESDLLNGPIVKNSYAEKLLVGMVPFNRVKSENPFFPDTLSDVILKPKQFSWTHQDVGSVKSNADAQLYPVMKYIAIDSFRLSETTRNMAKIDPETPVKGFERICYYVRKDLVNKRAWTKKLEKLDIQGSHVFMVEAEKRKIPTASFTSQEYSAISSYSLDVSQTTPKRSVL